MRKIEKRAVICMALAILLAAGMSVFLIKYFAEGGKWASSAFNRHLYDSDGVLISGTVLDRDGDVLSSVENGHRTYYENETVRKATLHAVGDLYGKIGTVVLNAFADTTRRTGLWAATPGRWLCITTRPARSCAWCRRPAMIR